MINSENKRGRLGRKTLAVVAGAVFLVSACTQPGPRYIPYPPAGKSAQEYQSDIAVCESWARSQSGASSQRALTRGAEGAVALGLTGAFLGWLAGDARLGGLVGAGIGAAGGGMQGAQQAQATYDFAYNNCLRQKGY